MREILLGLAVVAALVIGIGVLYGGAGKLSPRDQAYLNEMKQLRGFLGQVTDQPFNPPLPEHLYRVVTDQSGRPVSALFVHFDKPVGADQSILYIGDAVPGRFCDTPEVRQFIAQGYVHFHANQAASIETGHGNPEMPAGTEGWWLRHIAAGDKTMMGTPTTPGQVDFHGSVEILELGGVTAYPKTVTSDEEFLPAVEVYRDLYTPGNPAGAALQR